MIVAELRGGRALSAQLCIRSGRLCSFEGKRKESIVIYMGENIVEELTARLAQKVCGKEVNLWLARLRFAFFGKKVQIGEIV